MTMNFPSIRILLMIILLGQTSIVLAQKSKVRKANNEYDQLAYVDARAVYLKVVASGYTSAQIYESLGDTYYWNGDYVNAAQWYEALFAEFPAASDPIYYYRGAQALKSTGQSERSADLMRKYIELSGPDSVLGGGTTVLMPFDARLESIGLNSAYSDFGPTFLNDAVVFSSTRPIEKSDKMHNWTGQPFSNLYQARFDQKGVVTTVDLLKGPFDADIYESSPAFSKDGKVMYFTQNQVLDRAQSADDPTVRLKIVRASLLENNQWGDFVDLRINDRSYSTAHPALNSAGDKLYFSSNRPGSRGASDLWYVALAGDSLVGQPVNLGPEVNTPSRETFPFITAGDRLYYATDGRAGMGGLDIYSVLLEESPLVVEHLSAPINSVMDDFGFVFDEATKTGFITTNRNGVDSKDDDIFKVIGKCDSQTTGRIYDIEDEQPVLGAVVQLLDDQNDVLDTIIVSKDGLFSFDTTCDQSYRIVVTAQDYAPNELSFVTPNVSSVADFPIPLQYTAPCPKNDLGCLLKLAPIYFDFDRYNIRPDAAIELNKILVQLKEIPEIKIHIESHTDSRGDDAYNLVLSQKRAAATMAWFIEQGIAKERLTAEGYGETQLFNECANGVRCTDQEHELNRRSKFIRSN